VTIADDDTPVLGVRRDDSSDLHVADQGPGDPTTGEIVADVVDDEVPGQHQLGPTVEKIDESVERLLEHIRGIPILDRLFTTASHVGDFSLIWHVTNIALGLARRRWRPTVLFASLLGLESLIVNQGIKRLFRRTRPTTTGEVGLRVRQPRTSSFPSGHASSATFAAAMLGPRVGPLGSVAVHAAASVVATSRAYVRIHHASDVIAGLVTGRILAILARRLLRRFGLDRLL